MTNQKKLLSTFKEDRFEDFKDLLEYGDIYVDHFYGQPHNGTLLDLANRSPKNEKYVFELIRSGAKVWRKDEETGKLVIHDIFNNSDQNLLYNVWNGVYFSSRLENGNVNIMKVAVEENDIKAITRLAHSYSIIHDVFNDKYPEACQHLILLQGSIDAVRQFIEYFDVDKELQKESQGAIVSCREMILQKYPELEAELPTRSPSELQGILFSYLEKDAPDLFVRRIAEISTEILNDGRQNNSMMTYLHVACERNYFYVVNELVWKNVHLNEVVPKYSNTLEKKVTPIMLAAFFGHYKIFKRLVQIRKVELQNTEGSLSVLHLVLYGIQFTQECNHSTDGHRMILELLEFLLRQREHYSHDAQLISYTRLNIDLTDENSRTALYYALKLNNEFAIKLLLRAGAKLYPKDQSILTSISAAIIEGYFDDCIRSSKECIWTQGYKDNPIIFHYRIFTQLDLYSLATKSKKNFFARFESGTEMRKLYKRPLTKSLLYLKWRLVKKYYYINLVFYLSFCLALSAYIIQIQDCLPSLPNSNNSESTDAAKNHDTSSILCDIPLWIMWSITLLLYVVLILRELFQFSVSIRRYFGTPENWFEMAMIAVIGFLFANDTNTHLAATAFLTSWIGLILLLGKQPSLSIYIEMFKTVALNFAKFLLLYSILVASFAYGFFISFSNSSQNRMDVNTKDEMNENSMNSWRDLQMSFFKSIIMMTGEFEASTLPLDSNFGYGHVLFVLFVFLVTMVLYNLLNGLAVSDTRVIMEDAEIVALISRAKLISQIELLAISNPFSNVFKCGTIGLLERGYIFLRDQLFGHKILIDETKLVCVYPTKRNRIEIESEKFGKMPSTILKHAEEILEKRKQSTLAKNENKNSLTNVTKNNAFDSSHQFVIEKISNLEKLLQNVDKRFNKNDKLLESVLQEVTLLKNKDQFAIRYVNE